MYCATTLVPTATMKKGSVCVANGAVHVYKELSHVREQHSVPRLVFLKWFNVGSICVEKNAYAVTSDHERFADP